MKRGDKIGLGMLFVLLVCMAGLFLSCETEEVADFSEETSIQGVVSDLASPSTQDETEAAIRNLFVKAEIGPAFSGSRYSGYDFSDEEISDLAEVEMFYLSGEIRPSMGFMFESLMMIADETSASRMDFDVTTRKLEEETAIAMDDPERPSNSLLVAISAEGGRIPTEVPSYNENTVRSPVQMFLFSIWLSKALQGAQSTSSMDDSAALAPANDGPEYEACEDECLSDLLIGYWDCYRKYWSRPIKFKKCLWELVSAYWDCIQECEHDQGDFR
jgi:hypothetical protein